MKNRPRLGSGAGIRKHNDNNGRYETYLYSSVESRNARKPGSNAIAKATNTWVSDNAIVIDPFVWIDRLLPSKGSCVNFSPSLPLSSAQREQLLQSVIFLPTC
jgi:hypothetical protein